MVLFGSAAIIVGLIWDISWHMTIGRDTFWSPPHLAIYLGGVLAGTASGALILRMTFRRSADADGIRVWGMRGPLGAWVAVWGAAAMLTSAPFDDWWHNAYGLDVEIISPPHLVLAAGIIAIMLAAMLATLRVQNAEDPGRADAILFLFAAAILVMLLKTLLTEYSYPNQQRGSLFYQVSAAAYPLVLVAAARASKVRWPALTVAAFYMAITLCMTWILPLFAAQPRLGPIYRRIEGMVPPQFPLLLIIPAIAIDLAVRRSTRATWGLALILGAAFVVSFLPVQFFFSSFLMSPWADNPLFAGDDIWAYFERPGSWQHEYWSSEGVLTATGIAIAMVLAAMSARLGLAWGSWMRRVQR